MIKNSLSSLSLPRLKFRWVMLSFAFTATVLNYVDRIAFNYLSANGPLRQLIPNDVFGYIASAFFIAYMVSNLVSGFLIDKLGTRLGYALCMAFWTTASLLHAFARLPFQFGICRFLLGIGEAGNWPAAIKLTGEWFTPEERSVATGIFNSGAAIGAVVAPPLIAWLGTVYGWQTTFIAIGIVGYLWLALFWFTYYTPATNIKETKSRNIPARILISTKFVSWLAISKFFMDPIWYFMTFWIGRYLVDVHHWGLVKIGWFAMFPFILSDLGNILGGLFTLFIIKGGVEIARARKIAVVLFGTLTATSLMIGPFVILSPASALVMFSIAGFGYAAYTANTMALPPGVVPPNATASVWGLVSVGSGLGGVIFQSLSGMTIKHFSGNHNYTFAYGVVIFGYGVLAIMAVLIMIFKIGRLEKNDKLHDYVSAPEPGSGIA
jgi:MFS transporter, ACS family, hexuronate transporter